MNIDGLDKAKILCALYNRARPQGTGLLHYRPGEMAEVEARELLKRQTYFDYVHGRVLEVDLGVGIGGDLNTYLYDHDNGEGAAELAILEYLTDPKR